MHKKLTLNINESIIEQAKRYAKRQNTSISNLIESYLRALTDTKKSTQASNIAPITKSLHGIVQWKELDDKKDYTDFLSKKYE